jgi:hypothetical protein
MNAQSIYNMLVRKGITAIARTYPSKSFDPDNNLTTLGAVSNVSVKIIPPYKNREGYKKTELITFGKGMSGIANYNLTFTVAVGMKLIIASKEWTVTGYTEVKNATGILLYLLEIESGD